MNETMIAAIGNTQKDLTVMEEMMLRLKRMAGSGKQAEAEALLQKLITKSTQIVVRYRDLALNSDDPAVRAAAEKIIAEECPVEVGFTGEGWFALRMVPLVPSGDTASKEYIRGIINAALRRFFADKATVRYDKCTVAFRHVYDQETPEFGSRDYNNAEVKLVTDTVAMYVMVDDGPRHCRMFHCTAPGTVPRTEVYVMPQEDLLKWSLMEPDFPDEGVPLTDQVPDKWKVDI